MRVRIYRERANRRWTILLRPEKTPCFRLWDIISGVCLRVLEGHEELVRCIRFDDKRIVSGAYDGKIKVWDLQAALDTRTPPNALCLSSLQVSFNPSFLNFQDPEAINFVL